MVDVGNQGMVLTHAGCFGGDVLGAGCCEVGCATCETWGSLPGGGKARAEVAEDEFDVEVLFPFLLGKRR